MPTINEIYDEHRWRENLKPGDDVVICVTRYNVKYYSSPVKRTTPKRVYIEYGNGELIFDKANGKQYGANSGSGFSAYSRSYYELMRPTPENLALANKTVMEHSFSRLVRRVGKVPQTKHVELMEKMRADGTLDAINRHFKEILGDEN